MVWIDYFSNLLFGNICFKLWQFQFVPIDVALTHKKQFITWANLNAKLHKFRWARSWLGLTLLRLGDVSLQYLRHQRTTHVHILRRYEVRDELGVILLQCKADYSFEWIFINDQVRKADIEQVWVLMRWLVICPKQIHKY